LVVKIDHKNSAIAKNIYSVFQASYKVEAKLLKAVNFPPLKRTISEFLSSKNIFYGYYKGKNLLGAIEVEANIDSTHIQSLVVDPKYFRQGVARALVNFILTHYTSKIFTVETGVDNHPAIKLYTSFNFEEVKQWDTDHGVRKIQFKLS